MKGHFIEDMARKRIALLILGLGCFASSSAQRQDSHDYDLKDVSWRISMNEAARTIAGDVTNTIQLTRAPAASVWFDCGPLTITSVDVDGSPAAYTLSNDRLALTPRAQWKKGDRLKVRIRYAGAPTAGLYFVAGARAYPAKVGMVFTQGEAEDNRYWLPTYDFPDDKATVEAFIDVPPGQYALSNGKLLGVDKKPGAWTYHWRIAEPISTYLISFVAGDYAEGKDPGRGLPVLWYVPRGTERWGAAAFAGTNRMIDFYNRLTGFKYPFEKFSQSAVADFMFGGMENASCVTQTIRTLHKPENEPLANSAGLVAHELAHQWFGDTVTCMDWSHAWLNEGFASFLPTFWFGQSKGKDELDAGRYYTFMGALGSQEAAKRPVVSHRYDVPMDLFDGQIYGGGAARLFTLMGQIGEKPFWSGVKQYLETFRFKNATTEDFFAVMSRVSGRDLMTFREQFFYSSQLPAYTVSRRGSDVIIRQEAPGYDLDLSVAFLGKDEIEKEIPVHVHGPETVVRAPGLEHDLAVLDYACTAMVRIRYEDSPTEQDILRIFRLAPNAGAKLAAMDRFGSVVTDQDLLDAARDEKSRPARLALTPRLKRNAVPFLLELTHGFDREFANAAVNALGPFVDDPQVMDRLTELWTRDSNEMLRNTALAALLRVAKDSKLAEQALATDSQDHMFEAAALGWYAEHQPDVARQKCLDLIARNADEPLRVDAIRHLGALKDAAGSHRVLDVLIEIAEEPSYGSRMTAVSALASYGDARAIPVIEPLTHSSLFFTRRAAAGAIAQLRSKVK